MTKSKMTRFQQLCYRKKANAKLRNIEFRLSKDDFRSLLEEAGITEYDVGMGSQEYCLSRLSDDGIYERNNCAYITNQQNRDEQTSNGKRIGPKKISVSIEEHRERTRKSWETRRQKYGPTGRA